MHDGSKFFKFSPILVITLKEKIIAILVQVKRYLIEVLICIFLIAIDASFHVLIGCLYIFFGEMSSSLIIFKLLIEYNRKCSFLFYFFGKNFRRILLIPL